MKMKGTSRAESRENVQLAEEKSMSGSQWQGVRVQTASTIKKSRVIKDPTPR